MCVLFSKHLHLEKARAFFSHDYLTETFEKTMHAQKSICAENALDSHPDMWKASLFEEAYFLQDAVWLSSIKSWHNNKNEGSDDQKNSTLNAHPFIMQFQEIDKKKKGFMKTTRATSSSGAIQWLSCLFQSQPSCKSLGRAVMNKTLDVSVSLQSAV